MTAPAPSPSEMPKRLRFQLRLAKCYGSGSSGFGSGTNTRLGPLELVKCWAASVQTTALEKNTGPLRYGNFWGALEDSDTLLIHLRESLSSHYILKAHRVFLSGFSTTY